MGVGLGLFNSNIQHYFLMRQNNRMFSQPAYGSRLIIKLIAHRWAMPSSAQVMLVITDTDPTTRQPVRPHILISIAPSELANIVGKSESSSANCSNTFLNEDRRTARHLTPIEWPSHSAHIHYKHYPG